MDGTTLGRLSPAHIAEIAYGQTPFDQPGLYLLASGGLVEASEGSAAGKRLSGNDFDLLFAAIAGRIVHTHHRFRIDSRRHFNQVTTLHISDQALREFAGDRYPRVVAALRRRFADQMIFDVFISYAGENRALALQWRMALESHGLRVYMSDPERKRPFVPEIDIAIAESRVLLPIVSRDALASEWVRAEIEKRSTLFDPISSNILPVALEDGLTEMMRLDLASLPPIVLSRIGQDEAIRQSIEWISAVAHGDQPPPFKTAVDSHSKP
jgi:hypothetical protein